MMRSLKECIANRHPMVSEVRYPVGLDDIEERCGVVALERGLILKKEKAVGGGERDVDSS